MLLKKFYNLIVIATILMPAELLFAGKFENDMKRAFPGFKLYQKAEGDLNGDRAADYVAILWNGDGVIDDMASPSWNPDALKALLVIYFNDGKGSYHLQTTAPRAICVGCGGVKAIMGKPLGNLNIKKGVLWITYIGGSRSYWTDILKWRWDKQQKEFLLIGETYSSEDTMGEYPLEHIDINYSTQKAIRLTGKKQEVCRISSPSKENTLSTFDFANSNVGDRGKILKQCAPSLVSKKSPKKTLKNTDKKVSPSHHRLPHKLPPPKLPAHSLILTIPASPHSLATPAISST